MLPIHHTFGPHIDGRYLRASLRMLMTPWQWRSGLSVQTLEAALARRLRADVVTFGSGRQGLLALLQAMNVQAGDEIIVQAYTCVVVPNAIHAAGCVPVYADIDRETLNIDMTRLERLITPKTKAIICQHTFGIPTDTRTLRRICDMRGILLIEDCAHVLPDESGPADIAVHGDAMLLSFGRDKAISGVAGGAIASRSQAIIQGLRDRQSHATHVPLLHVRAYLCYPLAYAITRPLIPLGIGKAMLRILRTIGMLLPIVRQEEKDGHQPLLLEKLPNGCAYLALKHLQRLKEINDHRRMLTNFYLEHARHSGWLPLGAIRPDLPLQKFPMFMTGAETIRKSLKAKNIYLDDGWTGCVICPIDSDEQAAGYAEGSDPIAEDTCERILSLPTHPTMSMEQAEWLCRELDAIIANSTYSNSIVDSDDHGRRAPQAGGL